jgi:hydroxymethylbilane synthase
MTVLRLATRGSALAMVQSNAVAAALRAAHPGLTVDIIQMKTGGEQMPDIPLSGGGGVGLFTKELEQALLRGGADLAVHSLKDLPTQLAPGLALAAITKREDWRDAWLSAKYASPWALPQGATVGTGSPRRRAQLALHRPDLKFVEFRGNVDTRLAKLERGEVDGAVLAMAGLNRLGLQGHVKHAFTEAEMLPAPGQGFVGIETLDKGEARSLCAALNDAQAFNEATCERAVMARMEAGCSAPLAALARQGEGRLHVAAFFGIDGLDLRLELSGSASAPVDLGWGLAELALKETR